MLLTIAIPTYNRNDILAENLKLLLPQLTTDCKLLIIDNHSDTPVGETVAPLISSLFKGKFEIVRNRANIGGNANILRCIEYCDSDYLWILSDDDPVLEHAVATVFDYISAAEPYDFVNFSIIEKARDGQRKQSIQTRGEHEFVRNIDSYGRVLLISSSIYRVTDQLKSQLSIANLYQYSCAPHLLALILSLNPNSVCLFSHEPIIHHCSNESTPRTLQGDPVAWALGMPIVLDAPLKKEIKDELHEKLVNWITPFPVMRQLLLKAAYEGKVEESKQAYRLLKRRFFCLKRGLSHRFLMVFFDILMVNPKFGFVIYAYIYLKIKGVVIDQDSIAGRIS